MKLQKSSLLEEAFFREQEAVQLARLRSEAATQERLSALKDVSGIKNEAVLTHLVALDISPAELSALSLIPLVVVAWADGTMHKRESEAIVRAAEKQGIEPDTAAHQLLSTWLTHQPGPDLASAWRAYVVELLQHLSDDERRALHEGIMGRAHAVAEAAGGFLGMASVSAAEDDALSALDDVFHAS
jgi:uncharacterized tellurite resistance protein B-like protein